MITAPATRDFRSSSSSTCSSSVPALMKRCTKTVFVHLFISAGTLEEHVDELLERKSRVAGSVITEAEWLEATKLDE